MKETPRVFEEKELDLVMGEGENLDWPCSSPSSCVNTDQPH